MSQALRKLTGTISKLIVRFSLSINERENWGNVRNPETTTGG
jgi:RecA/RadA recombinase